MIEDEEIILNREKLIGIFKRWKENYLIDEFDFDDIHDDNYTERSADYFIRLFYELNPGV